MEQLSGLRTGETLPRGNSLLISLGFPACPHLLTPPPLPLLEAVESHATLIPKGCPVLPGNG